MHLDLEHFLNALTDLDGGWWPFLWLRPQKTTRIGSRRVLVMSVLYGTPLGLALCMLARLHGSSQVSSLATLFFGVVVSFFVAYRFTFAMAWNARAKRLGG